MGEIRQLILRVTGSKVSHHAKLNRDVKGNDLTVDLIRKVAFKILNTVYWSRV